MSVDLTRLYEGLGEVADAAAVPGVETIRARVRRRRVRALSVALSAIVVLVLLAGTAVWLIPRIESAVLPDVDPPASFVPFDPSAKPVVAFDSGFEFGYAISRPGRAYAMWLDTDRTQRVAAIDTTTGQALWPPTALGKYGDTNGMMVSRDAILMLTEQRFVEGSDLVGSDRLIAVDPATGKVMWERDYSFNDTHRELYDDVLVIAWAEDGRIEGLDLKTGNPKWTVNERVIDGGINAVRTHEDFRFTGFLVGPFPPKDRRVTMLLEDGRLQVRDVETGTLISERSGAGVQVEQDRYAQTIVVDEKLYIMDKRGLVEVALTGDSPARVVYPTAGQADGSVTSCGRGLLCMLERQQTGSATQLVMVDTAAGRMVWRQATGDNAEIVSPSGSAVLVGGRGSDSRIFGMDGKQLWQGEESMAMWVDSGNVLVFGTQGIFGHSLASGRTTQLGSGPPGYCGLDATHLTCPTAQGIFTWRYRN